MPAPSEQQYSTDYWIFEKLWWCRVPFNQSRSVEHIKHFGMPMSGDPDRDRGTANELVDRMITISRMVEYQKAGVHVYVKNRNECKDIYERISNHLQAWKKHLDGSLNVGDAPLQDLLDLDAFANVVYSLAKFQFTTTFVEDVLQRQISTKLGVSRGQLLQPKKIETTFVADDGKSDEDRLNEQFPDRQGMGSLFAQRLQSGSLNRGLAPPQRAQAPGEDQQRIPGFADKWK